MTPFAHWGHLTQQVTQQVNIGSDFGLRRPTQMERPRGNSGDVPVRASATKRMRTCSLVIQKMCVRRPVPSTLMLHTPPSAVRFFT